MQRGGALRGSRRQSNRRRRLLKLRPKREICAPILQRPHVGRPGRTVRVPIQEGQLAKIALPPEHQRHRDGGRRGKSDVTSLWTGEPSPPQPGVPVLFPSGMWPRHDAPLPPTL